ncbi:hypothetical protein [Aliarcobacter skirrowii]|uniref:hypothetical protein n=1 Tax=Aliarcobacter skirrowii TaxID=28200 RepID=UPI0013DECDA9|nr:hypothetical protein [Aliarcobacter skirrowii]
MLNPFKYLQSFSYSFVEPIATSFASKGLGILFVIVIILIILLRKKFNFVQNYEENSRDTLVLLFLGVIIFIFGSMPYIAVGKIPTSEDWNSRFQLLLPLGFAIIYYFIINQILKEVYVKYLLFFSIIAFGIFHIKQQVNYNIDWYYQESICQNMKSNEIIKNNTTFIFNDNINNNLTNKREIRFYEINGISKKAFGNTNRLFVSKIEDINKYAIYKVYKHYNFSDWIENKPIIINFDDNSKNLFKNSRTKKIKFFIKLKYLEIFDTENYKTEVKKLVEIR